MSGVSLKIQSPVWVVIVLTISMSLFRNGRGIAIQDIQTMANHSQIQRTKERNVT